jgi:hypothetical protein
MEVAPSPNSSHVCALFTSGGVVCWGSNTSGELGINNTGDARGDVGGEMVGLVPIVFADSITYAAAQVATGGQATCSNIAQQQQQQKKKKRKKKKIQHDYNFFFFFFFNFPLSHYSFIF